MSNIFTGYPLSLGDRTLSMVDHTGPASYVTGGEKLSAVSDFGFSASIEWAQAAAYTLSGNYTVLVLYPTDGSLTAPLVTLAWYVASTSQQVAAGTDLSREHIRLLGIGI